MSGAIERGLRGAPATGALLAINIGVFVAEVLVAGDVRFALGTTSGEEELVWKRVLLWLGANASQWTIADNRFETLMTSAFLHWTLLHLAFNMLALWQVGPFLERAIGPARFFPLYLASGVVGSAGSAIWGRFHDARVSAGASGAICGLIGAALVLGLRTQGTKGPLTRFMARWLFIVLVVGFAARFDNAAHVGGALGGAVVAATWRRGFQYTKRAQNMIFAACAAVVVTAGAVVFVRDRSDPLLFLDVEQRTHVALERLGKGDCDGARVAMVRASQMDPRNRAIRTLSEEIERECQTMPAGTPKPAPRP